jgi:CheY-like chemotaxis protein
VRPGRARGSGLPFRSSQWPQAKTAASLPAIRPLIHTVVLPNQWRGLVLVVEDNPVNCVVIDAMLGQLGLRVSVAGDGQQCLDLLMAGTLQPDLILMDMQMPVMGGIEATERIRAWEAAGQRERLPIVALTAGAFEEDRQRCLGAGMDDFLTKPIDIHALPVILSRWLVQA